MAKYSELNDDELLDLDKAGFINFDSLASLDAEVPNDVLNALGRDTVEASATQPITSEPAAEVDSGVNSIDAALFPRSTKADERGADLSEGLASAVGDVSSLTGRLISGLAGGVKRLIEGDLSASQQVQAYLDDIGQIRGTEEQNVFLRFIEDVVRDPALILSAFTGGTVGPLVKALQSPAKMATGSVLGKAIPYATSAIKGAVAGVTDVFGQDVMNDYALDEDKIQASDYALGGTVGAVMPFAADRSKKLGDMIHDYMKNASHTKIPAKQFDQIKPKSESFGIGQDAVGYVSPDKTQLKDIVENPGGILTKRFDKDGKLKPDVAEAWGDLPANQPYDEFAKRTIGDLLTSNKPTQAVVDLADKAELKLAPFMNKTVRGFNKAILPPANWGVDFANLVNRPIYGTVNVADMLNKKALNTFAAPLGDMLRTTSYRLPTDATVLRDQFQNEELENGN